MAAMRILNVEDEPVIRELVSRLLQARGYVVESCDSGEHAVKVLASGRQFEGVVCNLNMPYLCGDGVYDWLAEHRPELRAGFILTTGSVATEETLAFLKRSGVACLELPYSVQDLNAIVERVIGKASMEVVSSPCSVAPCQESEPKLTELQFTILGGMADDFEDVEQLYLYANRKYGDETRANIEFPRMLVEIRFPLRDIVDEIANMLREGYIEAKHSNDEELAPLRPVDFTALHHYWFGATHTGTQSWQAHSSGIAERVSRAPRGNR